MNQKGFINIAVIIGVIILVGVAGYFVVSHQTTSLSNQVSNPSPPQATTSTQNYSWKDNYLIGEWSVYLDCPNTSLHFKQNSVVEIERCGSEYETLPGEIGTYILAQEKIKARFPESGDIEFAIIFDNNEWKLKSIRSDQEFFWHKTVK